MVAQSQYFSMSAGGRKICLLDLRRFLWCPVGNRLWKKAFRFVALKRLT
jgi:hypothetical protein